MVSIALWFDTNNTNYIIKVSTSVEFNPDELLASRVRKPEIYTKAMLELKRLEEEPTCHRLAVKLLINNCKGLEQIGENEYDTSSSHLQKHHVESFAASLAICDLERGRFNIPHACSSFMSSTLYRIAHDGNSKLQVSPEQVGECLEALGQDHSHWNTWLSYRDKALLFCRAARFEIDKGTHLYTYRGFQRLTTFYRSGNPIPQEALPTHE